MHARTVRRSQVPPCGLQGYIHTYRNIYIYFLIGLHVAISNVQLIGLVVTIPKKNQHLCLYKEQLLFGQFLHCQYNALYNALFSICGN